MQNTEMHQNARKTAREALTVSVIRSKIKMLVRQIAVLFFVFGLRRALFCATMLQEGEEESRYDL